MALRNPDDGLEASAGQQNAVCVEPIGDFLGGAGDLPRGATEGAPPPIHLPIHTDQIAVPAQPDMIELQPLHRKPRRDLFQRVRRADIPREAIEEPMRDRSLIHVRQLRPEPLRAKTASSSAADKAGAMDVAAVGAQTGAQGSEAAGQSERNLTATGDDRARGRAVAAEHRIGPRGCGTMAQRAHWHCEMQVRSYAGIWVTP